MTLFWALVAVLTVWLVMTVRLFLVAKARVRYWSGPQFTEAWDAGHRGPGVSLERQVLDLTTWRPSTIQAQLHKSITERKDA